MWVNITRQCNQSCCHCHVDASPARSEQMPVEVIERCLEVLASHDTIRALDITGGTPELHRHFGYLVTEARRLGKRVVVRHNLTVTIDGHPRTRERKDGLPEFFADNRVELIASLPHYTRPATEAVRGEGVFAKSLEGIRRLNAYGYGVPGSCLTLDLVHNHNGPFTPAERARLKEEYRAELARYGLAFNRLVAVTNVPVNRFRRILVQTGELDSYMRRLVDAFDPAAAEGLVCRSTISVGLDGRLYDCDFNQMTDLPIAIDGRPVSIFNTDWRALLQRQIRFAAHCFGCTAGGGSG
jgi:radical SAM/Cys-rich protein